MPCPYQECVFHSIDKRHISCGMGILPVQTLQVKYGIAYCVPLR
ncbi:MAG: hypothetical protein AB1589_28545 [Cyanobacteriota bacterium]